MRNIAISLFALCFIASTAAGLSEPVIRADKEATNAGRFSNLGLDGDERSAPPVVVHHEPPLFAKDETVPVAKWDGGQLTNKEVSATLAMVSPSSMRGLSPQQFAYLGHAQQEEIVKQLAYEQILLQKAKAAGIDKNTPEIAKALKLQDDALLNRIYYQDKIQPRIDELVRAAAKDYYEENKDQLFTRPALNVIRDVHVSTYEMVTAEQGDTLAGLAKAITGNAAAAKNIRQGVAPYYLRDVPTELEDHALSTPLKAGEVLFVPMSEDARASATALAQSLREKALAGEDLDKIAASASNDFRVTATEPLNFEGDFNFYEGFRDAAASLDQTSVSQIIDTPAGLNFLVLQDRKTTEVIPFEEIKAQLESKMSADPEAQRKAIEETRKETLDRLWEKYDVKVNEQAVARPTYLGADPLSSTTVIAQAGDFKYTLDQFLSDLRLTGKDWGQLTTEERMNVLKVAPPIVNYLMAKDARAMGLDETEEFKNKSDIIATSEIVAEYKKRNADPNENHVTDKELRAFYTDHIDKYTSPAQVTLREISKRINMTLPPPQKAEDIEKAKKSLDEIRSRIHSEEDFAQLARRESQAISTRSRGGLIGTVNDNFRGEAFKNQLRQLKPGEVSEPFLYGSEVMIVRIDDRVAPTAQPFEDVRQQVMRDYARTMPKKLKDQKREKALEQAGFKLLF